MHSGLPLPLPLPLSSREPLASALLLVVDRVGIPSGPTSRHLPAPHLRSHGGSPPRRSSRRQALQVLESAEGEEACRKMLVCCCDTGALRPINGLGGASPQRTPVPLIGPAVLTARAYGDSGRRFGLSLVQPCAASDEHKETKLPWVGKGKEGRRALCRRSRLCAASEPGSQR